MSPRHLIGGVVLAAAAGLAGGCGIGAETDATVVGPAPDVRQMTPEVPETGPEVDDADESDATAGSESLLPFESDPAIDQVVLIGPDGEPVVVGRAADPDQPHGLRALDSLLEQPLTESERDRGLGTAIPAGSRILGWQPVDRPDGAVALQVELSEAFDAGGTEAELEQRIDQVVCTVGLAVGATDVEIVVRRPDQRIQRMTGPREVAACPRG